tara:strand:+ start:185 stop:409 length:225 start_codon:yes stop_codon:yes gene_type:complete
MCTPSVYGQMGGMQSGGSRMPASSMGARLDKAQRDASANYGGGSAPRNNMNSTLLGTPRNSDQMAIRKNTLLGV